VIRRWVLGSNRATLVPREERRVGGEVVVVGGGVSCSSRVSCDVESVTVAALGCTIGPGGDAEKLLTALDGSVGTDESLGGE